jgi:small subunit ribosomal protein S5
MSEILETPSVESEVTTPDIASAVSTQADVASTDTKSRENSKSSPGKRDEKPRGKRDGGFKDEPKEFAEELLAVDRVTRVTAGGRQLRFRASVVIGNGKGMIGLGIGKSNEVQGAIEKAVRDAKKNLIQLSIVHGTIAHDVTVGFKSSEIFLHPAHPGTGIIAGGAARKIFAISGIKDIIAKQHGSPNKITNARVTIKALSALKPAALASVFNAKKIPKTETNNVSTPVDTQSQTDTLDTVTTKKTPAKSKK